MMKIFKIIFAPLIALFTGLYYVLDKILITPLSKLIYYFRDILKNNSGKIEKILSMPNVLFFFSLICAFSLVVLVDREVISFNDQEANILTDQPVSVEGLNNESYIIEGVPEKVDITLIGNKGNLFIANRSGNNKVYLDLRGYGAGTHKVKLKYKGSSSSIKYKLDPSSVTVKISSKISEERSLAYDLLNENSLNQKLSISKVELNTSSIVLKSSKEILDKVSVVKALVDIKNLGSTDAGEYQIEGVKLVAYDSKGDKVNNVEFVPDSVTATITLNSYSATKPVKVVTTGQMQSGFAIDSITSSVSNVTVYGSQSVVDSLDYVEAIVNVSNLNSNVSNKAYDLVVPNGIRYMSNTTTQVSIKVGAETQKVLEKVPIRIENLSSELNALAVNEENQKIDVIVKGTESVVQAITAEDVKVYVDLSGLGQGVQKVTVQVSCSDTRVTLNAVTQEVEIKLNKK